MRIASIGSVATLPSKTNFVVFETFGEYPQTPFIKARYYFMKNRKRNVLKRVFYSEDELEIIYKKMLELGTNNYSAFCRKMTLDGYIIKQDFTDIKNLIYEINKIGTNINQIAKNVNETNTVHKDQLEKINNMVEDIWHILKSKILNQL